ncbi:MAG: glycoside hydrolase family 9 protein [Planctomycetota bacterium]
MKLGFITCACLVLTTFEANIGLSADSVRVGRVRPDILEVQIDEGSVELGKYLVYEPQPGDMLDDDSPRRTILKRSGKPVGFVSGNEKSPQRFIRYEDRYTATPIDRTMLTNPKAWEVELDGEAIKFEAAHRKSVVNDIADRLQGRPKIAFRHFIYLKTAEPIKDGILEVSAESIGIASLEQQLTSTDSVSSAIHVSHVGFRPADPIKRAVFSCWMGDGGAMELDVDSLPKFVVMTEKGDIAQRGQLSVLRSAGEPNDHRGLQGFPSGIQTNYAGTTTYDIRFDDLKQPGEYRVAVEGIGTSRPFLISDNAYDRALNLALQGLRYHRWGVSDELRLIDGTTMNRPGATPTKKNNPVNVPIRVSNAPYKNANFGDIVQGDAGPFQFSSDNNIVGGYMDAGDFDRNFNHNIITYLLCDVAGRMKRNDLGFRHGFLDDARWNADLWLKLQDEDGGIPSAIEYSEHPRSGEPSWLNTLPVYLCAPHLESNMMYAIAAAKLMAVESKLDDFKKFDLQDRRDSCDLAIDWVEKRIPESPEEKLADLYLWMHTERYAHEQSAESLTILKKLWNERVPEPWQMLSTSALHAAATLLELPKNTCDSIIDREKLAGAVRHTIEAVFLEGSYRRSSYGALKHGWVQINFGNGSFPAHAAAPLVRLAKILDDAEYLEAVVAGLAYAYGGNPHNMAFITGLNDASVKNILHCDTRATGHRAPSGITVYGPADTNNRGNAWPMNWHLQGENQIYPAYENWPAYENVHQFWNWGMVMEYTVHQTQISAIYFPAMLRLLD